jgi:uncharacterized protein
LLKLTGLLICICLSFGAQAFQVPGLTGPIVDEVGVLNSSQKNELSQILKQIWGTGKAQIQVLIVPTLGDEPIEQVSLQVVEKWALGSKKEDNGILFLISVQDKKLRIEVGQGLEGDLPDAIASRIIRQIVVPYFREGKFSDGIAQGILAIVSKVAPDALNGKSVQVPSAKSKMPIKDIVILLLGIIFFIFQLSRRSVIGSGLNRSRYGGGLGGGGYGGGGFGGGGGSGGGWSGGGGGFSGGGSSGSW